MPTPRKDPDSPPQKSICNQTQMAQRTTRALSVLLEGGATYDLARIAEAEGWNVSDRQLQTYMSRAAAVLKDNHRLDRLENITWHVAIRGRMYKRAMELDEIDTALNVAKDLAKIQDVYPPKQDRTVIVKDGALSDKTDAELDEIAGGDE